MQTIPQELQEQIQQTIAQCTRPICDIIDVVLDNTAVGPDACGTTLTMDELYAIAIRLPAECAYLQAQINMKSIEQKMQSFLLDTQITDSIVMLQNTKGDAKERQRRAEAMSKEDVLADIAAQEVINALQAMIQRADKIYEGIKKVIDARGREMNFDSKPGRSVAM